MSCLDERKIVYAWLCRMVAEFEQLEVVQIRLLNAAETFEKVLLGKRFHAEPAHAVDGLLVGGPEVKWAAVSDCWRSE